MIPLEIKAKYLKPGMVMIAAGRTLGEIDCVANVRGRENWLALAILGRPRPIKVERGTYVAVAADSLPFPFLPEVMVRAETLVAVAGTGFDMKVRLDWGTSNEEPFSSIHTATFTEDRTCVHVVTSNEDFIPNRSALFEVDIESVTEYRRKSSRPPRTEPSQLAFGYQFLYGDIGSLAFAHYVQRRLKEGKPMREAIQLACCAHFDKRLVELSSQAGS
jgi:hypothetical protein